MKATLVLTALLGAAIANPVAIANVDSNAVVKRNAEIEVRQLSSLPISNLPGLSALSGLGLPGLPNLPVTPANIISTFTTLLQGILGIINNIRAGVPGASTLPSLPAVPTLPGVPAAAIPTGAISAEQFIALIGGLKAQVGNVTSIGSSLPAGLSLTQLQQLQTIVATIQSQLTPLLGSSGLPSLPTTSLPGGLPDLTSLTSSLGALSNIFSLITSLLGPLLGGLLGGALGGLGGRV